MKYHNATHLQIITNHEDFFVNLIATNFILKSFHCSQKNSTVYINFHKHYAIFFCLEINYIGLFKLYKNTHHNFLRTF